MVNILMILSLYDVLFNVKNEVNFDYMDTQINIYVENYKKEVKEHKKYIKNNTWKNESKQKIVKKINRYLNSNLKNKGEFIVSYSIKKGVDPYLVTAVMLLETGCYWNCSKLVRTCNNVGGNKGTPSCNGGSYRKFNTLDDGIRFTINKLNSYYKRGLKTPKQINKSYAEDKSWYKKVNTYIKKLKS